MVLKFKFSPLPSSIVCMSCLSACLFDCSQEDCLSACLVNQHVYLSVSVISLFDCLSLPVYFSVNLSNGCLSFYLSAWPFYIHVHVCLNYFRGFSNLLLFHTQLHSQTIPFSQMYNMFLVTVLSLNLQTFFPANLQYLSLIVVGIGCFFCLIFHVGTREVSIKGKTLKGTMQDLI